MLYDIPGGGGQEPIPNPQTPRAPVHDDERSRADTLPVVSQNWVESGKTDSARLFACFFSVCTYVHVNDPAIHTGEEGWPLWRWE